MPSAHVTVSSELVRSPRVMQIEAMFDVPASERAELSWEVELPLDEADWNVGLIVGPSGCGKTTIARELFGSRLVKGFRWAKDRSILDSFPEAMGTKEIVALLTAVGFGSPPAWLRPFHVLSGGEQFRVSMARAMAESTGLVVVDEFTSVVDRQVARVASHAVQKAVRRQATQLIAVSCHYDIVDWLQPDWVYEPQTRDFARRRVRRHPPLELEIRHVDRSLWPVFASHHYLNHDLSRAAHCVGGFIGGRAVAFASWQHFPHPRHRNIKRAHRFVVLPDYQGLGISARMAEWVGQTLYERGFRFHFTSAHPAVIAGFAKSPRWELLRYGRAKKPGRRNAEASNARCLRRGVWDVSIRRNAATFVYRPAAI